MKPAMIGSKRWGLFSRKQVAVPWFAVGIDEQKSGKQDNFAVTRAWPM